MLCLKKGAFFAMYSSSLSKRQSPTHLLDKVEFMKQEESLCLIKSFQPFFYGFPGISEIFLTDDFCFVKHEQQKVKRIC